MYSIEIKDLDVNYGNINVLKNLSVNIKHNEFVGIIGPNGGGKTTLLKAILGLVKPVKGSVSINKDSLIGYVPQYSQFDRTFPIEVIDVILMGKLPKKIKWFSTISNEDKKQAESIMKDLGIYELKNRQIGKLSGGQLQKVLIARALVADPQIFILDEPTSNIDTNSKKDIFRILKKLNNNKTILIVSHDLEELAKYIDSIICVNKTVQYIGREYQVTNKMIEKFYNNLSSKGELV